MWFFFKLYVLKNWWRALYELTFCIDLHSVFRKYCKNIHIIFLKMEKNKILDQSIFIIKKLPFNFFHSSTVEHSNIWSKIKITKHASSSYLNMETISKSTNIGKRQSLFIVIIDIINRFVWILSLSLLVLTCIYTAI